MVSRYHWLRVSNNLFLGAGTSQTVYDQTFTIPAGGILKKILLNGVEIIGTQSGNSNLGIGVWTLQMFFTVTSGPDNNRKLYTSTRRIPFQCTAYTFGVTNEYTSYMSAGDNECGVDQEYSLGKSTSASAWTIRLLIAMHACPGGQNANFALGKGSVTMTGNVLYYL